MNGKSLRLRSSVAEFLFVIPALILYLLFVGYPLIGTIVLSLTSWDGVSPLAETAFVGLSNYINAFSDKYVLSTLGNTFVYAILSMIFLNVLGLLLAIGLEQVGRGKNFYRALFYSPSVLSSIIVGFIFNFLFSGPIADLGSALGISSIANNVLGSKDTALFAAIFVAMWKGAGWYMVIYIAGLQNIDQSLYEAADIDGATPWKKFRYVTFPLIAPAFTINMVLSLERAFKEYDLIFALTGGGPGRASELFSLTIYNESFVYKHAGYGSALGMILFVIIVVVTLFQMFVLRRREDDITY